MLFLNDYSPLSPRVGKLSVCLSPLVVKMDSAACQTEKRALNIFNNDNE